MSLLPAGQPFVSVLVQPSYGAAQAVVSWSLSAAFKDAGVLIYRSLDGLEPYTLLNPDDQPLQGVTTFLDTIPVDTVMANILYRLDVEMPDGTILDGEVVGFFEAISERDHRTARAQMCAELKRLSVRRAGVPAFTFNPRIEGAVNQGYDGVTGTLMDLCAFDAQGGAPLNFSVPFQTWVQILTTSRARTDKADGGGITELVTSPARLPGFPQPVTGALIVLPYTDNRYVVGDTVQAFLFRGLVPIAYQVQLTLLPRTDARYKVPVPKLDPSKALPGYIKY